MGFNKPPETMTDVLVVDPDEHSRLIMEVGLRGAGMKVATVSSGAGALRKLAEETFDLVISEVSFPKEEPFAFGRRLRAEETTKAVPLIFITRLQTVEDKIAGLEIGAEDYLTKPIYLREFVTRIRAFLRKSELADLSAGKLREKYDGRLSRNLVHDILRASLEGDRSGQLELRGYGRNGTIRFRSGRIIQAETDGLGGVRAAVRLILWNRGDFTIRFADEEGADEIGRESEELFEWAFRSMRRLDEIREQYPRLQAVGLPDLFCRAEDLVEPSPGLQALLALFDEPEVLSDEPAELSEEMIGALDALDLEEL